MSKSFKIIVIVGLLVLLAPKLVLFLASISLIVIAIPIIGALIYFGPALWKLWHIGSIAHGLHGKMYKQRTKNNKNDQKNSQTTKNSNNGSCIDLDKDDYSVIDDDSAK